MAKTSTPQIPACAGTRIHEKQSNKESVQSPSDSTITALLNFSKSLSIPKSASIGKMFVVGN